MNSTVKQVVGPQVSGLKFAGKVVAAPMRIGLKTEWKTLHLLGVARYFAWFRLIVSLIPAGAFVALMVWLWLTFGLILLIVGWLAMNQTAGYAYQRATRPSVKSKRGLKNLMVMSEIVKLKDGEKPPKLSPIGKVVKDEFGTTRKFRATGSTTEAWVKKSDMLAGIVGVPSRLFAITQDDNDAPNVMTIWVGKPNGRKTRTAIIPMVCDFHEPFRIGQSLDGKPVLVHTFEFNTLIGGIPGMGKTATVRQFILRCLLDPEGRVYLVDGKGSKKDYRDAVQAYSGYIDGNDDDALEQVEMMLEELHAEINRANGNDSRLKILLVLDEWQDIRAGADKDTLKRIDTLIIRIHKKGRATGFHLLLATQRASAVSIPTEMRALFRQAIGFRQKNGTDYGMVLGHAPDGISLPGSPGESIVMGDRGMEFALIDFLPDPEWVETARRLTARPSMNLTVTHETDPLSQAIRETAQRLTSKTVSPTEFWEMLPEHVRPANASWLSRHLAKQGIEKRGAVFHQADLLEAS
jgi:hypothetical protein